MRVDTRLLTLSLLAAAALSGACSKPSISNLGGNEGGEDPTPVPTGNGATTTYYKDVLPIVNASCKGCHTQGGASFALDTYDAAKPYSGAMHAATESTRMPPFPPDADCNEYEEENVLTAAQKATIKSWHDAGAPAGNPNDAPPPPAIAASLGTPDRALDPGGDYTFDPNANQDLYWCFRVNPNITAPTDFTAAEVFPGNKEIVHHVIVFREANGQANPVGLPGFECGGAPGEFMFAWVPGSKPLVFPEGIGMQIQPNDRLLMQIHYSRVPNAASQVDRTKIGLHFAEQPVTERARVSWLGTPSINIPPNQMATASAECAVPANAGPVKVLMTAPHMHTLATSFKSTITRANGSEECLIDIPRWDFGWQGGYSLKETVTLQPGDKITSTCNWNNTTNAQVGFGEGTGDEMCFNFLYVVNTGSFPRYCFPGGELFDIFAFNGGGGSFAEMSQGTLDYSSPVDFFGSRTRRVTSR